MSLSYFAYGSNMSLARMSQRIPSARQQGLAILEAHRLCFHKASTDGSAKCDALATGDPAHRLYGMLYSIDRQHKPLLDEVEGVGKGYQVKTVSVVDERGKQSSAFIYCATSIDNSLIPYSWYLNHVVIGAREASLPKHYIDEIVSTSTIEDKDIERDRRERAVHRTGSIGLF